MRTFVVISGYSSINRLVLRSAVDSEPSLKVSPTFELFSRIMLPHRTLSRGLHDLQEYAELYDNTFLLHWWQKRLLQNNEVCFYGRLPCFDHCSCASRVIRRPVSCSLVVLCAISNWFTAEVNVYFICFNVLDWKHY